MDNTEKYRNAKLAMDLGLATALATAAGVYLVYGEKGKAASIAAGLTGIVLYIAYYCKLKANPTLQSTMKTESNGNVLSSWESLSNEDIERIRRITNSSINPFRTIAEP